MNRLTKWLSVVVLITSVGGHWAILQGVAWTTMLVGFAQSMPLGQAIEQTFDGQHPCPLCLTVKQGRSEERRQESSVDPVQKLLVFLDVAAPSLILPPAVPQVSGALPHFASRRERPPYPPPRPTGLLTITTQPVIP